MRKPRIGVVGLGGIAQKAWLPVLAHSVDWTLVGGYSPNQPRAQAVCASWRIPCFSQMAALAAASDAVFVHSSTASHFAVVRMLLEAGVDVCVDKPLAATLDEAEQLVALAAARGRKLMVAFNRRFAPRYLQLKAALDAPASLRMDKHRTDSVGAAAWVTLLDDYLHVVDTALWLAGGEAALRSGQLLLDARGALLYAEHHFQRGDTLVTTSMHRRAGSQRESVLAIDDGACMRVEEMRDWQCETARGVYQDPVPGWQSTLEQRGFAGAARHFIACVANHTAPHISGEEALRAQRWVTRLWQAHPHAL
ncbi:Gfo/Idh/MocA family protein [Pantoea sp. 1.19]|uniref:Gfo/Idh/MocA family protein n=1 Tax=Pantoea sp. 1.19 TaxID=1925589 RepID=UPI000948CBBF|nr:Gfo/Idh/MocA family oxidoreductase [Pantoea sp. 1.19]